MNVSWENDGYRVGKGAVIGSAVGALAGWFSARATRTHRHRRTRLHRTLIGTAAGGATGGTVALFVKASSVQGLFQRKPTVPEGKVPRAYDGTLLGENDPKPIPSHVQSVNAAIYPAGMMGRDTPPADLGESVALLQPGDLVEALSPSVANPKGVMYTLVTVRGREGLYWIRSSSIAENASIPVAGKRVVQQQMQVAKAGMPWWGWLLLAGGGVAVVGTGVYVVKK